MTDRIAERTTDSTTWKSRLSPDGGQGSDPTESTVSDFAKPSCSLKTSFGFAFSGLFYAVRTQRNMRIHLALAGLVIAVGVYLGLGWTQWAVLALTVGFVLVAELFNTVAEAALDAATPYYHPLVKVAKDVAAAAVLVTAIISVLVGLLILGPPLVAKFVEWLG